MTFLHSIILGIVEGITEFLPISSTGHLIITSNLLHISQNEFTKSFEIIIQLGAILAVASLYFRKIVHDKKLWKKILVGFIPTAVIGYFLYAFIKTYLLSNLIVVAWALLIGGIIIVIFEHWYKAHSALAAKNEITYRQAFIVGIAQALAVVPGVSRSGATIVGGLLQGLSRARIVEFSFLLALPTMAAATGLDILKTPLHFSHKEFLLLGVGLLISFITARSVIKWFVRYIQKNTFTVFGIYRIILGALILVAVYLF